MRRGAVAAKLFWTGNVAVTGRQESLAVDPRKFPLCSTNSHPRVRAVRLAVPIRSAAPATPCLMAEELDVNFPLLGRSRETRPVRFVHHRYDPISTANRLVPGDFLHFKSLKRSPNVVSLTWCGGAFLEKGLSTYCVEVGRHLFQALYKPR